MNFYTKKGTLFATGYTRVVIGGQGPYIEFEPKVIAANFMTKPGQEYRGFGKYDACKYFWLCPVGEEDVKVYHQRGLVTYADYKVGYYYVSPDQLDWDGSALYAEQGSKPGEARPTEYKK